MLVLKIIAVVILAVAVLAVVVAVVAGRRADRKSKPLDVEGREPVPFDQFFHEYFEAPGAPPVDKEVVRSVLDYVAKMSTLPADRLRLEDGLDEIAAAGGFKRAAFLGFAMGQFDEATPAMMRMMRDGHMTNLSQLVVTIALGTAETRAQAARATPAQENPPQDKV